MSSGFPEAHHVVVDEVHGLGPVLLGETVVYLVEVDGRAGVVEHLLLSPHGRVAVYHYKGIYNYVELSNMIWGGLVKWSGEILCELFSIYICRSLLV